MKDGYVLTGVLSNGTEVVTEYVCSYLNWHTVFTDRNKRVMCNLYHNKYKWFYILRTTTGEIAYRSSSFSLAKDFIMEVN